MFELSFYSQQGAISTPHNHQGFGDFQDPLYVLNSSGSSQLLADTQLIINTVIQSIDATKDILTGLNSNSQIDGILNVAFGQDYQTDLADEILQHLAQNNFTNAPEIKLVSGQNFNGAYAKETNTIYLSQEFVAANLGNLGTVTGVLLEEFGHYIDGQINVLDAAGDEGNILSRLLQGQSISGAELLSLKLEDDHDFLVVDGLSVGIEKNDSLSTAENLGTLGYASYGKSGWVGGNVPNDYYRFQINGLTKVSLNLVNLQSDVDIKLLGADKKMIYSSTKSGTSNESISSQLAAGTYYIHVYSYSGNSNYNLGINTMLGRLNPSTDVDGDGKADAIVSNDNGVTVRRSTGTGFSGNETWTEIGYSGTKGAWFADVTGDGRADAIVSNADGIYVRRSDGTKFLPNEKWTEIGYGGTYGTWFADVTGDGRADAIVSNADGIYVRRASSDGTRFLPNEKWTEIGYSGTQGTFFADVTGDGKADAIVSNNNWVTVRRSTGTGFSGNERWTDIGYGGTNGAWYEDATGDGKADAIVSNADGIYVRRSTGTGFSGNEKWTEIGYGGTQGTFFGDVTGDGKADAIVSNINWVTVRRSTGIGFSGNEQWTEIGYGGTKGTFIGKVRADFSPITRAEYLTRLYRNSSSGFSGASASRFYEDNLSHGAIDSTDNQGSYNVYSLVGGQIKFIGEDSNRGKYIDVWNNILQRTFRYLHFDSFNPNLRLGSYISQGDWLGIEGNTGYSFGRHTHIESRLTNGTRENPLITLGRAKGLGLII
ncbi:VCBS repeat-containing protein [Anabaena sphaerica FACHB-251]|uniref:VCBS repeat-containing protein n=1 Tax=Anabaena sphaerica FACHB-251 TaxID=2692883 RepID=A0A926WK38_9NOST|nr:FG-GAP-like repeat-containing protein [Anabaena sphaerica]MBD2296025.1 VCBS repeat-containing protein [Anabaena sphaerica FACHB-251]